MLTCISSSSNLLAEVRTFGLIGVCPDGFCPAFPCWFLASLFVPCGLLLSGLAPWVLFFWALPPLTIITPLFFFLTGASACGLFAGLTSSFSSCLFKLVLTKSICSSVIVLLPLITSPRDLSIATTKDVSIFISFANFAAVNLITLLFNFQDYAFPDSLMIPFASPSSLTAKDALHSLPI